MADVGPYKGSEQYINWRKSMAFKGKEGTVSEIPVRAWVHGCVFVFLFFYVYKVFKVLH